MNKGYISSKGRYFEKLEIKKVNNDDADIVINTKKHYQTHVGFGGAITNAVVEVFSLLNQEQQDEFIQNVYSDRGLNYDLARLTIGSCDFAVEEYDYFDSKGNFSLEYEEKGLFPLLRKIEKIKKLKYMASSWSPPAIWKDTGKKSYGGKLKEDAYLLYAEYLATYVKTVKDLGFDLSMMTIQNEPEAVQIWESCLFTPEEEAKLAILLKQKLKEKGIEEIELFLWDHNRDCIVERIQKTLLNSSITDITSGFAYHWYDPGCHLNLTKLHNFYPDKKIMFTEGCVELLLLDQDNPEKAIGSFKNGLRYATNYLRDSENYSSGFIDWNILLNEKGGPNHVGNFCEAPILFNRDTKQLVYNPSFYTISHFSRFIRLGAVRVESTSKDSLLEVTAYENKDKSFVIVMINNSKKRTITLKIDEKAYETCLLSNSIATIHIKDRT